MQSELKNLRGLYILCQKKKALWHLPLQKNLGPLEHILRDFHIPTSTLPPRSKEAPFRIIEGIIQDLTEMGWLVDANFPPQNEPFEGSHTSIKYP